MIVHRSLGISRGLDEGFKLHISQTPRLERIISPSPKGCRPTLTDHHCSRGILLLFTSSGVFIKLDKVQARPEINLVMASVGIGVRLEQWPPAACSFLREQNLALEGWLLCHSGGESRHSSESICRPRFRESRDPSLPLSTSRVRDSTDTLILRNSQSITVRNRRVHVGLARWQPVVRFVDDRGRLRGPLQRMHTRTAVCSDEVFPASHPHP